MEAVSESVKACSSATCSSQNSYHKLHFPTLNSLPHAQELVPCNAHVHLPAQSTSIELNAEQAVLLYMLTSTLTANVCVRSVCSIQRSRPAICIWLEVLTRHKFVWILQNLLKPP